MGLHICSKWEITVLKVLDTPLDGRNALSHSTTKLISSMIILFGSFLNGRVLLIARTRSLIEFFF
jgi:hypothetical protein